MKYSVPALLIIALLMSGCSRIAALSNGPSFQEQLSELLHLKESGSISEQEYQSQKQQVFSLMMH